VFAGAIVRSVGGLSRPAFPVEIGKRTLISPSCLLSGCEIGRTCYIATGTIVLQGASIGNHVCVGAGAIVHATTAFARPFAGRHASRRSTSSRPRSEVGAAEQASLHEQVMTTLIDEVHGWRDERPEP
jgi:carbonic anhydrase/acetyltransferase-like protein (isoleucine patch superfamily)